MVVLEDRFPRWDPSHGAPDGIVVLGGAIALKYQRRVTRSSSTNLPSV